MAVGSAIGNLVAALAGIAIVDCFKQGGILSVAFVPFGCLGEVPVVIAFSFCFGARMGVAVVIKQGLARVEGCPPAVVVGVRGFSFFRKRDLPRSDAGAGIVRAKLIKI